MTDRILSVISELGECVAASFREPKKVNVFLKEDALFRYLSGEPFSEKDSMVFLMNSDGISVREFIKAVAPYINLLKTTGFFEEIAPEQPNSIRRSFKVGGNQQVDIMFTDVVPKLQVQLLHGKVKKGHIVSIQTNQASLLQDAIHDVFSKTIRIYSFTAINRSMRYHIWLSTYEYLCRGWKIDQTHEPTKNALPHWLLQPITLPEKLQKEGELCPLTHEPLANLPWIANTICQHYFDAEALIHYYINKENDTIIPCPMCRSNIFIEI